jgi:hypothetical protein
MSLTELRAERVPGEQSVERDIRREAVRAEMVYAVLVPFGTRSLNYAAITGLPAIGAAHPDFAALRASRYDDQEQNGRVWRVRVSYEPVPAPPGGSDTKRIISSGWNSIEVQRDLIFDALTGAPVLNTAGDAFEQTLQVPRVDLQFVLEQEEDTAPSTVMPFSGTLNSDNITFDGISVAAKHGRMLISCRDTDEASRFDYLYTYTITVRTNIVLKATAPGYEDIGWREGTVSQGYRVLDAAELKHVMVEDDDTGDLRPVNSPVLLDSAGAQTATPYVQLWDAHVTADWSTLKL